MTLRALVCLANSYKHSHRCVAGIDLSSGKWIRPISRNADGAVVAPHYGSAGDDLNILDAIEIDLTEPCPRNCHPEDWYFSDAAWRLLARPIAELQWNKLKLLQPKSVPLLGGYQDRLYARRAENGPLRESLALIKPEDLWWWVKREKGGKRKCRALFRHHRVRYDLALTDPTWLDRLEDCSDGIYPHQHFFRGPSPETLLTTSLSEVFQGFHYKLVAGVVCYPGS